MPSEILGQVYEQFLGKIITLRKGGASVESKPEVKKAGGVYYTPADIVRFITQHSLNPFLNSPLLMSEQRIGKKLTRSPFRIVDPACGSGSFLIEVYQQLLDWHSDWYIKDGAEKHSRGQHPKLGTSKNLWHLSV